MYMKKYVYCKLYICHILNLFHRIQRLDLILLLTDFLLILEHN